VIPREIVDGTLLWVSQIRVAIEKNVGQPLHISVDHPRGVFSIGPLCKYCNQVYPIDSFIIEPVTIHSITFYPLRRISHEARKAIFAISVN
jgi:hypothetical protein